MKTLLTARSLERCRSGGVVCISAVSSCFWASACSKQSIAILLFTLLWFLLAHLFVILYEEPHLRATFGEPYDSYCHPVCRWLPTRRMHSNLSSPHA
jgi:protein-S-isoprenylcysteine O-methyltransferase Ste14